MSRSKPKVTHCWPLWLLLGSAISHGASFDCSKASHPVEVAICQSELLSRSDEALGKKYRQVLQDCKGSARERLISEQKRWLMRVRSEFVADNPDKEDLLHMAYQDRSVALDDLDVACAREENPKGEAATARVRSLGNKQQGFNFPFVETSVPGVGRRINRKIFSDLLGISAPLSVSEGIPKSTPEERNGLYSVDYRVERNRDRLLILNITTEGCGASCSTNQTNFYFDLRNGRNVMTEDLFGDQGYLALKEKLKAERLKRGKVILARKRKSKNFEADELERYAECLGEWQRWAAYLMPFTLGESGGWRFFGGGCDYVPAAEDGFAELHIDMTMEAMTPYLSAYGRSLLLNQGDVRDPTEAVLACPVAAKEVVDRPDDIAQISAGEDHFLLLKRSGALWAWGANFNGQLGNGSAPNHGRDRGPHLVGNDFVQAGAGQFWSAGLRRDRSLWTWGSSYEGRLGRDNRESPYSPARIMDDVQAMAVNAGSGIALKQDGSLWTWGGKFTGKYDQWHNIIYETFLTKMADDVVQSAYGPTGQVLMLKRDGSLWSDRGFRGGNPQQKPGQIGAGFSRLAAHQAELAFKSDGSLWAWGQALPGYERGDLRDRSPVKLGDGFVRAGVSADGGIVVALKKNGSLWATHQRGRLRLLKPVGCGYIDATVTGIQGYSPQYGVYVLAIRQDGSLVAWGNWQMKDGKGWVPSEHLFMSPPRVLGNNFTRLYQVGGIWGSFSLGAFIKGRDGSLWQWNPPQKDASVAPMIMKVSLPVE